MAKITLFSQVLQLLPKEQIKKIINDHGTDKCSKSFDTWSHLVSMIFCQFTDCNSLRDISHGMRSAQGNLNHLGVKSAPSKSTIAYQNEHRNSKVFKDIYYEVFNSLGQQVRGGKLINGLKRPVKLLDSTLISLCMSVYDWALYTQTKGAIKLHTLLDFKTYLPEYVYITDGKGTDNKSAREVKIEPNSIVVSDRGYCDFNLLNDWDSKNVFFVVRHKANLLFNPIEELNLPEKRHQNILKDEIIELIGSQTKEKYTKPLRRVVIYNEKDKYTLELLTNNFKIAASTISELYKARWRIETFFRTIKDNFQIKSFVGTSRNAVEIQIWTALITIVLLAYMQHIAKYTWHFSNLVHSMRLNTFTKIDLHEWINNPFYIDENDDEKPPGVSSYFNKNL